MKPFQRLYQRAVEDTGELEDREKYRPGGYHPIHFNDDLGPNERFNVIHKLGWSVNSTMWLCFDKKSKYYRSLKVMTAEESEEDCPELRIMKALSEVSSQELDDNYIIIPHEHFWLQGPNGRHLCLVSDFLGPSLYWGSPLGTGIHTPEILTGLSFQVSKGLQYLHKKGICHGDLRPSNILMQLHQYSLIEMPDSQLHRYLGPRAYESLQTLSGATPSPHGPKYLALPASLDKIEAKCRTGKVALVDFSHSSCISDTTRSLRWHRQYAGPELLFTKTPSGLPQDIWALACIIYEVKLQSPLFSEIQDYSSLIRQMESWFGPLPIEYRNVAKDHLVRDKRRLLKLSDGEQPSNSAALIPEDRLSDSSQPLSLSPDEYRRAKDLFLQGTDWSNPLQAALGEETKCYIYEKNDAGHSSSDSTDSDSSDLDWSSEDEDSKENANMNVELEIDLEAIESPGMVSEHSEETNEELDSPSLRTPPIPVDPVEQSQDEQRSLPGTESQTETKEVSQTHDADEDGEDQTESPPSPQRSLGKRSDSESREGKEVKRRRTDKDSKRERDEPIELVVCMPKEEVLLLSDLLLRMFKHDPKERLDIDAVVNHEYWGDRRNNWPVKREDLGEEIPDPISSRTRSRVAKAQQQVESDPT
ncbi:kinase-like domain-containing protein [Daldinia eschscholtzii]|nr:kinase-like domain-containing protein [Daldinia eschscholtzii]